MFFLQNFYNNIAQYYSTSINHFALIKLIIYSLDKSIFYFLILLGLRFVWHLIKHRHRPIVWRHQIIWGMLTFYLLLLLFLTVFRDVYFPWQLHIYWQRPLSEINTTFLTQTFKLIHAQSSLDFFYNFYGNIFWFIPFGILFPLYHRKRRFFWATVACGLLLSLSIESLQFLLYTGIADIDDVTFNTLGTIIGYGIYKMFSHSKA